MGAVTHIQSEQPDALSPSGDAASLREGLMWNPSMSLRPLSSADGSALPLKEYYVDSPEVIFGVNKAPDAGIRPPPHSS